MLMHAAQAKMRDMLIRNERGQDRGPAHASHSTWVEDATRSYFRHRLASVLQGFVRPSTSTHSGLHGIHLWT
jgi:hypothetical protein